MGKTMSLEELSSIKGATSSKAVEEIFNAIKKAHAENRTVQTASVSLNDLRDDEVNECSAETRKLIKQNFPKEKNGYLVVQKVIEE